MVNKPEGPVCQPDLSYLWSSANGRSGDPESTMGWGFRDPDMATDQVSIF
jgi:hypothetical protein